MTSESTTNKPFRIEKRQVFEAYKAVKANHGAAGVDGQSLEMFEKNLAINLYKIWNRMSSGTYFPPPVRAVSIPKKSGGERILGVPTVGDRIAQMVVKQMIDRIWKLSFFLTPMDTGRGNRPWTPSVSHARGAGSLIGFWSSTSRGCLIIFRMNFC